MLIHAQDLSEQADLACDVCIIGSGAAGITLSLELARRGVDTICVSGGDIKPLAQDQQLYQGVISSEASHEPLETYRIRALGGSTTAWGGRLVPFDSIDFERRSYVPLSGWPISFDEIERYFPRATRLCECPSSDFDLDLPGDAEDLSAMLGRCIVTNRCERWSMPTDFGQKYAAQLRQCDKVRVLIGQHCSEIMLDESCERVHRIRVASRGRSNKWIYARIVVLACGGLENARLLLASRSQARNGIGNQNDMVGRCYMGHISGTHGRLRLERRRLQHFYRLMTDEHGMYLRRRLWLSEETQRERQLMNIIAFPFRPSSDDPSHSDAVLSLLFLADTLSNRRWDTSYYTILRHCRNVFLSSPLAWALAAQQFRRRFQRAPRVPFLLPYRRSNREALYFQSEHAPNPSSRVVLTSQLDEFGMPRLSPRIAFSEIDTTTVLEFYAILDRSLRHLKLGSVEYTEPELRECINQSMQCYDSHAHHIGTTRMAENPREGVVDANSRVHGIQNLYVAGSSVFPTSGHANPTLTLIALTLRLADFLATAHQTEHRYAFADN
jgi:choline dehydrogenase-like flavoprotein